MPRYTLSKINTEEENIPFYSAKIAIMSYKVA